jgi:predicted choloylglycine hydrolase
VQVIKKIDLTGNHYEMGYQHGRQVVDMRAQTLFAIDRRLETLQQVDIKARPFAKELYELWEKSATTTLDMLKGIADGLELEWQPFFRYTIASYLLDRTLYPLSDDQGCTVLAAAYPTTRTDSSLLVKNRDYWLDHRNLQILARARPLKGYKYIYLTSAGSPGVFSSGMNEAGLAVADTHVVAHDTGPGLARFSVMMELLEHHNSTQSALDYLRQVQHIGNGTIVILDAQGGTAVYETGHKFSGIVLPENGYVVSANHFVTPQLADRWEPRGPEEIQGNSLKRYTRVSQALHDAKGLVDIPWAQALMSSHGDPLEAICRHPGLGPRSVTISSIIFQPMGKTLLFATGNPCLNHYIHINPKFQ